MPFLHIHIRMSLLAADYSDSDSSSASDNEEVAPVVLPVKKTPTIVLPRVDDIFKETKTPSFLVKPKKASLDTFDIDKESLTKLPPPPVEWSPSNARVDHEDEQTASSAKVGSMYQFPGVDQGIPKRTKHLPRQHQKNASDHHGHKRKGANADTDKASGKDRVKQQRLKGQSGIGSDFKSWKSETEMKMRQGFD
ncbi:hypothetical protein DYB25_002853 [Aphanomyces astaci]|uniref:Uncharacterized protein n=1 Tax=Aphanomyces astaci TaxID=112090 RepID=A0A397C921_APHAT|nr:hypothetical protein DYB25_002853 [Aphanomyces astaci]RHY39445.1 hypothetical protein DYB30_002622 [Aphanomyces astaci]RHY57452.1 hypothetical protein DYB34_000558 [Aphanomyces astaci]RHY82904.1 hypothetical protein DYB26_015563 [Aphanomyces astaci]RHZ05129.1 hypothetical protein DYB31_008377 [Aphanomyces astaci]